MGTYGGPREIQVVVEDFRVPLLIIQHDWKRCWRNAANADAIKGKDMVYPRDAFNFCTGRRWHRTAELVDGELTFREHEEVLHTLISLRAALYLLVQAQLGLFPPFAVAIRSGTGSGAHFTAVGNVGPFQLLKNHPPGAFPEPL
jgi:hypothetical protein